MSKKILIACPVHNREWVLDYYLEHIVNIDYPKELISLYFIINNNSDNSDNILKDFKQKYKGIYANIKIQNLSSKVTFKDKRTTAIREFHTYDWLSSLRNKLLNECVKGKHDYLFSCDSDILVPSNILKRLLSHKKDVVASLIYNGYLYKPSNADEEYDSISKAYQFPNILNGSLYTGYKHIVNDKIKNPQIDREDSLIPVDFTGAVFLASNDVCKIGRYSWNKQGEDEPFCRSVKQAEYDLYCDTGCYSQHMMNEEILDLYLKGNLKFENGDIIRIK